MDDLLEGDFDAEAWDKQMAEAFNDDYYEARLIGFTCGPFPACFFGGGLKLLDQ